MCCHGRASTLERYSAMLVDDLLAAANAGAVVDHAAARTSKLRKAAAPPSRQHAAEASSTRGCSCPLRERLERCMADGDGDNARVTKKVRSVYREWKTQHIDEQLDDVIRAAHGRGVFAAIELGTPIEWDADPSPRCLPRLRRQHASPERSRRGRRSRPGTCSPRRILGCRCLLVRRWPVISAPMRRSSDLPVDRPRRRSAAVAS